MGNRLVVAVIPDITMVFNEGGVDGDLTRSIINYCAMSKNFQTISYYVDRVSVMRIKKIFKCTELVITQDYLR